MTRKLLFTFQRNHIIEISRPFLIELKKYEQIIVEFTECKTVNERSTLEMSSDGSSLSFVELILIVQHVGELPQDD